MAFGDTCKECLMMLSLSECLCCGELDLCVDKIGNNLDFPMGTCVSLTILILKLWFSLKKSSGLIRLTALSISCLG